jgi:hypothetical protein
MSTPLYIFSISIPLLTILAIFAIRYLALTQQAKARIASDEAYRALAEKAAAAETAAAASLAAIQQSLADVRTRLASVEKILKDVE